MSQELTEHRTDTPKCEATPRTDALSERLHRENVSYNYRWHAYERLCRGLEAELMRAEYGQHMSLPGVLADLFRERVGDSLEVLDAIRDTVNGGDRDRLLELINGYIDRASTDLQRLSSVVSEMARNALKAADALAQRSAIAPREASTDVQQGEFGGAAYDPRALQSSAAAPSSIGTRAPLGATWDHFDTAYRKACASSQPDDWMQAALIAQQVRVAVSAAAPSSTAAIDMLLFCPRCGMQHVDAEQPEQGWTNPPHATHTCQGCGLLWRPANVNTNGVLHIAVNEEKHRERILASWPRWRA